MKQEFFINATGHRLVFYGREFFHGAVIASIKNPGPPWAPYNRVNHRAFGYGDHPPHIDLDEIIEERRRAATPPRPDRAIPECQLDLSTES